MFLPFVDPEAVADAVRRAGWASTARHDRPAAFPWRIGAADMGFVEVEAAPFRWVTTRIQGFMRPSIRNVGFTSQVGPIPLFQRRVMPVQYHFLVPRPEHVDRASFKADWVRPGWASQRARAGWTGARLAERLDADATSRAAIAATLPETAKLWVRGREDWVRIVVQDRLVMHALTIPPTIDIQASVPDPAFVTAVAAIAMQAHAMG